MTPLLDARARLIARGLVSPDFRLTDAGNRAVEEIIAARKTASLPARSARSGDR